MTKFKRGCQAQSRSYKRGGAKGYGANRGRAHGALESGRRADGDRRGGGTGQAWRGGSQQKGAPWRLLVTLFWEGRRARDTGSLPRRDGPSGAH